MGTVDLSTPPSAERFAVIDAIRNRAQYELGTWNSDFDVVFEEVLAMRKKAALSATQRTFNEAVGICEGQRRDIFTALGGVWDPQDPQFDEVASEKLTAKISKFQKMLDLLCAASFEGTQRSAANTTKINILRGTRNSARSNAPGIAIQLTPAGQALLLENNDPPELLPGTTSFFYLPMGSYWCKPDGQIEILVHDGGISLTFDEKDVLTVRQMPPTPVNPETASAEELNSYNAPFWHNAAYLPNGEPHKFYTPEFQQAVKDEGLTDML